VIKDPTWIFLVVLAVILLAPIVLRRLRIPSIIGLIVAGIVLGEHGLGLIERDRSFEIFGQVGIYLIMFMAGLGLNMGSVKRYGREGLLFGVLTFLVPFFMGLATSYWMLGLGWTTSMLMACIFSSHTLVTYPVVQRYSLSRHPKVVVSVVATAFTTFLSLLILAVVIDMENARSVWDLSRLALSIVLYGGAMLYCVPRVGRWFLRRYDEPITQFIFMLLLLFLSAALARLAGIAPLLGAFLCGLLVNRLIPRMSPLMNRIEFFANAFFVPYFLIGVGMLIDVHVFLSSQAILWMAVVMVSVGLLSKWIAAALHQGIMRANSATRLLTFGLSSAHSAGALAIVMTAAAPEVGLLGDDALDATVMLILFSCIVSSIATDRGARRLAIREARTEDNRGAYHGRCLTFYEKKDTVDDLTQLSIMLCNHDIPTPVMGLTVTFEDEATEQQQHAAHSLLERARLLCTSADVVMRIMSRVSNNVVSGIQHATTEYECGEVLLSYDVSAAQNSLLPKLVAASSLEVVAYDNLVPPSTLRRIVVAMPQKAELEVGFYKWVEHVCRVAANIDALLEFHAHADTLPHLRSYLWQHHMSLRAEYHEMPLWTRIMSLQQRVGRDDLLVFVLSRPGFISYRGAMSGLPLQLRRYFSHTNIMLIYPDQGQ
jgi:Kef-type K+ transport system membrane component KefB